MKWASAISQAARLEDALDEALECLIADLDDRAPDLIVAFASPDYSTHLLCLGPQVIERFPGVAVLGCSAGGVIGGGHEIELTRALSLTGAVLPGVERTTFHLGDDPDAWRERIGVSADQAPAFILLADPLTCPAEDLVRWMDATYPESVKIGGLASGGDAPGSSGLMVDGSLASSGAVGVALCGDIEVATIVAQGCRPIGAPVFVTRAEGNLIFELDGEPALSVLEALYKELPGEDQTLFRHGLFLGLVTDQSRQAYEQGDFLIRNLAGIVPQLGALAVASEVADKHVVQFHLRDAATSAADLAAMLTRYEGESPEGALVFSCLARGERFYGQVNHDSSLFREHFGDVAVGGFFGNGEIGPVGDRTFLHTYTSSFGLFSPRRRS
jgi:small ligand-binding sensory domain FIST